MRYTGAGIGLCVFLLAQVFDATTPAALPALAIGCLVAAWRDELDLSRALDAVEFSVVALVAAWLACSFLGSDPRASLALSVPLVAFVLIVFALRRSVAFDRDLSLTVAALVPLALTGAWIVVPNDVAWVAVAMPLFVRQFGVNRVVVLLIVAVTIALALFAQSRLALLVIAVALAGSIRHRWLVVAAVPFALVGGALMAKGFASLGARGELAWAALQLGRESPGFGIGPHRFGAHYLDVLDVATLTDPRLTPWPHSLPLELWAETGVVGLMAVGALIYSVRRCSRSQSWGDRESAVRGVIGGLIVAAAFEASTLRVWTWVIAALVVAMAARVDTGDTRNERGN